MKNEKIMCRHCQTHIGNKHHKGRGNYAEFEQGNILVPTKKGIISKTKVRGTRSTERYGNYETSIGYIMETQFTCNECSKRTTVETTHSS